MLQDLSWLNNCSFCQLEDIRKAIVNLQVDKANALVEKIRWDVNNHEITIQNIDNQIKYIDNVGLSGTYKDDIREWRNWQYNINQLKQYNVNSATMLDSFRYLAKACGLDGSLSVEDKLKEWNDKFSNIINDIPRDNSDQYQRYQRIQELKRKLSVFRGQNQQLINNIQNMLYENDFYVYKEIGKQTEYITKFQKYSNALILLSGCMEILKRDSWKNLTNDQIIQEINQRINNMYDMCVDLSNPSRSYFNNNCDINNNSISNFGNGYNNGQQQLC